MIVRRLVLTLLLATALSPRLHAQVSENGSGTPSVSFAAGTSASLTTFTVDTGSNLCLIGIIHHASNGASDVSMEWDSAGTPQSMTSEWVLSTGLSGRTEIFSLVAPTTGNLTLAASWTGSVAGEIGAVAFADVDQADCVIADDDAWDSQTSTTPSLAVTSGTDDATLAATTNASATIDSTDTQTEVYREIFTGGRAAVSYALGGTSNTHTWTIASGNWWHVIGVHIKADDGGGGSSIAPISRRRR